MNPQLAKVLTRSRELLAGLAIPDNVPERREPCVVLSCHDVDRGLRSTGGGFFSPLLAPIGEHCRRRGKPVINLSHPPTVYPSAHVDGGAVSINRAFTRTAFTAGAEKRVLGKRRAEQRSKARRTALYRDLLLRLKAERIFSIEPPRELCRAAHDLGIPLAEAMHGMNIHPADRIFMAKFDADDHSLASAFLTFDSRTQETLSGALQGRPIRTLQLPHPWHVEVHRADSRLRGDTSALDALARRFRSTVLVTLNWGYDGERALLSNIIPNGILHPAIEQAIAASSPDVLWLLRLHPIQVKRERYRSHRAYVSELTRRHAHVESELASSLPLPLLLARCSAHVTMISGAAGEAALFGVPSLMLCPTLKPGGANAGLFSELVDGGMVTLGELDAGAIEAWVAERRSRQASAVRDWEHERARLDQGLDELLGGGGA